MPVQVLESAWVELMAQLAKAQDVDEVLALSHCYCLFRNRLPVTVHGFC